MMDETVVNNAISCEQPVVEELCNQQDKEEDLALCETESSSSESSEVSSQDTPSSQRKSVKFQNVEIKEYGMILGDHPSTSIGPSITIEWDPVRSHVLTVDDYESAFDQDGRRRGQELRMPESVRKGLLRGLHSESEMRKSRSEVRRIQSQRNMTRAMEEIEHVTSLIESAGRKYKKWMRRRRGVEPEPAEAWVQLYKQQDKDKNTISSARTTTTTTPHRSMSLKPTKVKVAATTSLPLRKSTGSVGVPLSV